MANSRISLNRYAQVIEHVFLQRFRPGDTEVPFNRDDLRQAAEALGIRVLSNIGDIVYTFRYRASLPPSVLSHAPEGMSWIIRPAGQGTYRFVAVSNPLITPTSNMVQTKIPDATPGLISMYALSDEQALLAKLRYNRLVDIFTGVTCYSLQNHLRTSVPGMGQVETDEVYVGVDRKGVQYVFPVQAKGGNDVLGVVQIEQDYAMCSAKFPTLICRPIAAQFISPDLIALFDFEEGETGLAIASERHYRLVPPENMTEEDLRLYRTRT